MFKYFYRSNFWESQVLIFIFYFRPCYIDICCSRTVQIIRRQANERSRPESIRVEYKLRYEQWPQFDIRQSTGRWFQRPVCVIWRAASAAGSLRNESVRSEGWHVTKGTAGPVTCHMVWHGLVNRNLADDTDDTNGEFMGVSFGFLFFHSRAIFLFNFNNISQWQQSRVYELL